METIEAHRVSADVAVADLDHLEWHNARPVWITRYWSGEAAPPERHFEVRLIWSHTRLTVRFLCRQREPLVVNQNPQLSEKTIGLWERDVCELFIAPDLNRSARYFEFEVAPTGEWLDLALHHKPDARETNWDYCSDMTAAARIAAGWTMMALSVPWHALGQVPQAGGRWRGNLFRCVGAEGQEPSATRGYLAWQPTYTQQPNFHVPAVFGYIRFAGST